MERKCKTCDKVVGKGKSYCIDNTTCKPSSHNYLSVQDKRECKTCGILVGKGKSYCSSKCQPGYRRMLVVNRIRSFNWRKENPDYHKEYDALRRPKRYCLDCGVEIPKGRFRCDTHWIDRVRLQWRAGQQKSYYLKKGLL